MRQITILGFATICLALLLSGTAADPATTTRSYLVLTEGSVTPAEVADGVARAGGTIVRTIPQIGVLVVSTTDTRFAERASTVAGVEAVTPNLPVRSALGIGTDETLDSIGASYSFEDEWMAQAVNPPNPAEDDPLFDAQWNLDAVDAPEAWDTGERGADARVFILDTGIAVNHPDLAPNLNLALCKSFVPGEPVDPVLTQPGRPLPFFNHGSHVAGIIAAADNAFGTIGVAPETEIVAVKVLSSVLGFGWTDWIADGIVYAADNGADVINMSLGGVVRHRGYLENMGTPGDPSDDIWVSANEVAADLNLWKRALQYANKKGVTIVVSAGNGFTDANQDQDAIIVPAQLPYVISISATAPVRWAYDQTTNLDEKAPYSNFGPSLVDLSAPGGAFDRTLLPWTLVSVGRVTGPDIAFDGVFNASPGGWFWVSGTSMSAPHVSAVAALIISKNGGSMKPSRVYAALKASADDIGSSGRDGFYGHGRVNAYEAVR